MYNIIYISTAVKLFNDYELAEILAASRENNKAHNVTGMLLYAEGTFIQVIEGERTDLAQVYGKILKDKRHHSIIELAQGPIAQFSFSEWSMGFVSVNADVLTEFEGYIDPKNNKFLNSHSQNAAVIMLRGFAESNSMN